MSAMSSVQIGRRPSSVTLSDSAVAKVSELLAEEDAESLLQRVGVKPGGCSGYSYDMFFDTEIAPDDVVSTFGDVRVVVDAESAGLLKGATVDFSDGLNGAGFHISNSNATKTCGCGSSFS
jgi:iron-sulfur cluster assembly accessory protein